MKITKDHIKLHTIKKVCSFKKLTKLSFGFKTFNKSKYSTVIVSKYTRYIL